MLVVQQTPKSSDVAEKTTPPTIKTSPLGKILEKTLTAIDTIEKKYSFDQKPPKTISTEEQEARQFFDLIKKLFQKINEILPNFDEHKIPENMLSIGWNVKSLKNLIEENLGTFQNFIINHPSKFELAWELVTISDMLPKQLSDLIPFLNPKAPVGNLVVASIELNKDVKLDETTTNIYSYKISVLTGEHFINLSEKYFEYRGLLESDFFKLTLLPHIQTYFQQHFETSFVQSEMAKFQLLAQFKTHEQKKNRPKFSHYHNKCFLKYYSIKHPPEEKNPVDIQKKLEHIKRDEQEIWHY